MSEEYQIGIDIANLKKELQLMQGLVQQLYGIVEYNIKSGKLEEPKEEKRK